MKKKDETHAQTKTETLTRRFSKISRIAQIELDIPASSAAIERLFSNARKIYCPERCRLSDSKFEQCLLVWLK